MRVASIGFLLIAVAVAACDRPASSGSSTGSGQGRLLADVTPGSGLDFGHRAHAEGDYFLPEIMGPGVALLDYDGDGDLDVYALQGNSLTGAASGESTNRLFASRLAETGRLVFDDVTAQAGVADNGYAMGAAVGDVDNDGDPDLYVTNFGADVFYMNDGVGRFRRMPGAAGADDERWGTSAAFLDFDRDGDLDLFVTAYVDFSVATNKVCGGTSAERDYCSPVVYDALPDRLYRNDGGWRFTDVTARAGVDKAFGAGLGVAVMDYDSDGWLDLYVANDRTANQLWRNLGDGRFEEMGLVSGAAYNALGMAEASMGVTAGDFDADGHEDLFMTHYDPETNTLFRNDGAGGFVDVTTRLGLAAPSLNLTGWGTAWLDVDNDRRPDLFVANGGIRRLPARIAESPRPYEQRNQLFMALADGGFAEIPRDSEPALAVFENSRGAAFGDLDNDGRVDVVIANNEGPLRLLLNTSSSNGHWLSVELQGDSAVRDGQGSLVGVSTGPSSTIWRRAGTGGSYLSAGDHRLHFGLGDHREKVTVQVAWTDGSVERWDEIAVDRILRLRQGSGRSIDSVD